MTPAEMNRRLIDAKREIDEAYAALGVAVERKARTKSDLLLARSLARPKARRALRATGVERPTVDDINAWVDIEVQDAQLQADLADAQAYAAKRLWEQCMAYLSALQTQSGMIREEARLARTGPQVTP